MESASDNLSLFFLCNSPFFLEQTNIKRQRKSMCVQNWKNWETGKSVVKCFSLKNKKAQQGLAKKQRSIYDFLFSPIILNDGDDVCKRRGFEKVK